MKITHIIKKIIPKKFRPYFQHILDILYLRRQYHKKGKKTVFIVGTPYHGNIGDSAITYAEKKWFENEFDNYYVREIEELSFKNYLSIWKHVVKKKDIVTIQGGGNLGDVWCREEEYRLLTVKIFPHNKIISFPQTMWFENENNIKKSADVYNKHKKLTLIAREQTSFNKMKNAFSQCNILLAPDLVLTLDYSNMQKPRNGVALCFRTDMEKYISDSVIDRIREYLNEKNISISNITTVEKIQTNEKNRKDVVVKKLDEISGYKLVITDRLHCMIFSAITGTPCIAFPNGNNKVRDTYEWIKDCDYIKYTDDILTIDETINNLLKIGPCEYNNSFAKPYYNAIKKIISEK